MMDQTRFTVDGRRSLTGLFLVLFFFSLCSSAQIYRYLGVEDGFSSHKIYRIQKDSRGYMWFLTSEGIDRYDGHSVKHYLLPEPAFAESSLEGAFLLHDSNRVPWVVSAEGAVARYDERMDRFSLFYALKGREAVFPSMGCDDSLWLFTSSSVSFLNLRTQEVLLASSPVDAPVTAMVALSDSLWALGTERGLCMVRKSDRGLQRVYGQWDGRVEGRVDELYYDANSQRLVVANFSEGILLYDRKKQAWIPLVGSLEDTEVHRIAGLGESRVLIATGGKGLYQLDLNQGRLDAYLAADYNSSNRMNVNNLRDLYIDESNRLWMACFAAGVTVQDPSYAPYQWLKHAPRNIQSLINDQIHDVIEDSEGDLWFATSNGISLYRSKQGTWQSFFSTFDKQQKGNHIFLTLCEVRPGLIWAGGLASGIYQIQKAESGGGKLSPIYCHEMAVNQYIYDLQRDSQGFIWSGGDKNLKSINLSTDEVRCYEGVSKIVTVAERDSLSLWVGTETGLYLLNRRSGLFQRISDEARPLSVTALYPVGSDSLYIASQGAGLLLYSHRLKRCIRSYRMDNSALLSNHIYTILPNGKGDFLLGTECGISLFSPSTQRFRNWTGGRGLRNTCFNTGAATLYQEDQVVFGGTRGAVIFAREMQLPDRPATTLLLRNFSIAYQSIYPGEKGSPLLHDLDSIRALQLSYKQRSFSLEMASVDYDDASNVLYSWRIKELNGPWSPPSSDGHLYIQNLPSGHYTLQMRALSKEEPYKVLDERALALSLAPAPWASSGAYALYFLLFLLGLFFWQRLQRLRRQKRLADERRGFFIQTAHDIRTPLTLMKAPMEEVLDAEKLSKEGNRKVRLALRQVDGMLQLVGNLMDFERSECINSPLNLKAYDLNSYLQEVYEAFAPYAQSCRIHFELVPLETSVTVWFDRDKMDSILKNVLSNAFKYTPAGGAVSLLALAFRKEWGIQISDSGSGIPQDEQKNLFKSFFRGRNSVNMKVPGSGIGLMLVQKFVSQHKGRVKISSRLEEGTVVRLFFPKDRPALLRTSSVESVVPSFTWEDSSLTLLNNAAVEESTESLPVSTEGEERPKVMVVEDNDELRRYLVRLLSDHYQVKGFLQGKEALDSMDSFCPDLVVSDVLMPELSGDQLCARLKRNFQTSHIPVVLLTALSDEKYHLKALSSGADDYLTKPFAPSLLKARLANILANRERLRQKFGSPETLPLKAPSDTLQRRDWNFVTMVNRHIEEGMQQADFSVDTLCEKHHMSRTAFYHKLKAVTGHSPSEHIRLVRLHQASRLLQEGYNVSEVADMCGFCDAKYFREVFKRHFNENPSEHGRRGPSTTSPQSV